MRKLFFKSSCAALTLLLTAGGGVGTLLAGSELFYRTQEGVPGSFLPVRETLFEPCINGYSTKETALVIMKEGFIYADREDLNRWRIRINDGRSFFYRGHTYIQLLSIKGLSYFIDYKTMKLQIEALPEAFLSSRINAVMSDVNYAEASPFGAFFNYDLMIQRAYAQTEFNGLGEIGIFGSGGLWLGDFLYRGGSTASDLVRLETTYRKDWPENLKTLKLGDAITRNASLWGSSVRFGGIQWGTDFQTQPNLVTAPLLQFGGETALPSTVDLYVNDVLQMHRNVLPGPFTIDQPPVVSGFGEARVVVTDLLGREQIVRGSFYASPMLLRGGLEDYSIETGFMRENFAIHSNDYSRFLAAGTYRKGITDTITAELHSELTAGYQNGGISGAWRWDNIGIFSTAAAVSYQDGTWGSLGTVGYEHLGKGINIGGTLKFVTREFTQIGTSSLSLPRLDGYMYAGYALQEIGFLSANYIRREYRDRDDISLLGLSFQHSWRDIGSLQVSAIRTLSPNLETSLLVYFSKSFGDRRSGSLGYSADSGGSSETARFKKNLPTGPGDGYSLTADLDNNKRLEALYERQTDYGTYGIGASHTGYTDTLRATTQGAIATMDGKWFLSRRIDQSFAVVDTGDYSGIGIYKDNRYIGKSGKDGMLLIPNLRANEKNPLSIEECDLPLESCLPYVSYDAIPSARSGVLVSFPLKKIRRAVLTVVLEEGGHPPTGAVVQIEGKEKTFPVGRDGRVYLEEMLLESDIRISWADSSCGFTINYPQTDNPMPNLGTYICKGEKE